MDFISVLPFDMIISIGLALSPVEVAALSRTCRTLAKLGQSEIYWRLKLQQDYASYILYASIDKDYQKVYRMFHQLFHTGVEDVSLLNNSVVEEFSCHVSYITLIYPVPPFTPIDRRGYRGDIQIISCEGYSYIGMRRRETINGSLPALPAQGDDIPNIHTPGFDSDFNFYAIRDEYFRYGFVDFFWCIRTGYLPFFLKQAHSQHYMQIDAYGKCEEIKPEQMK